jgi:tetratricopeptide (TPR) repeat protein
VSATLRQAIDSQRAGRRDDAERAYHEIIDADPAHPVAHHNLGILLAQTGRIVSGLPHLKLALESDPGESLYWFSYVKGLLTAGDFTAAETTLQRVRQRGLADGRFAALMDSLGSALLARGNVETAIRCYRDALEMAPAFADAHHHLGSALSENGRIAEGFEHYMRRAALVFGGEKSPPARPDPPHKVRHDLAQREYLGDPAAEKFHLVAGERIDGPAVNPARATPDLLDEWHRSSPQMIVVDDFLTLPALQKLRDCCAGSTVWRKIYEAGYLGAAPEDGFASPLLAQIVEETAATYATILDGARFQYLGAFKYDSDTCAGTNTHGDNALVNVNLYITPDDANLDPQHGGMMLWDSAAASGDALRHYNRNEGALLDVLSHSGAKATVVPHRANRAVIFKSTLFHRTDRFRFKSDYLSRRINVSMLFGQFDPPGDSAPVRNS